MLEFRSAMRVGTPPLTKEYEYWKAVIASGLSFLHEFGVMVKDDQYLVVQIPYKTGVSYQVSVSPAFESLRTSSRRIRLNCSSHSMLFPGVQVVDPSFVQRAPFRLSSN